MHIAMLRIDGGNTLGLRNRQVGHDPHDGISIRETFAKGCRRNPGKHGYDHCPSTNVRGQPRRHLAKLLRLEAEHDKAWLLVRKIRDGTNAINWSATGPDHGDARKIDTSRPPALDHC